MLVDASVARSFAVVGWTRHLLHACGGTIFVANAVHGIEQDDPSELGRIRAAIERQARQAGLGSGLASRALAAVQGLDELLALGPHELKVLTLDDEGFELAVRLQSRRPSLWPSPATMRTRLRSGGHCPARLGIARSTCSTSWW